MSRNYPDRVRVEKVAAAERQFSGSMPLQTLQRVADLLTLPDPEDVVNFRIQFGHDGLGRVVADVMIETDAPLTCQRTLDRFLLPIKSQSRVGIVSSPDQASELPEDYEPLVCETDELEIARLVEEELILALPLVPMDPSAPAPDQPAEASQNEAKEPTHRPFEVLAKLKKERPS